MFDPIPLVGFLQESLIVRGELFFSLEGALSSSAILVRCADALVVSDSGS
jgi:hypothetical protein